MVADHPDAGASARSAVVTGAAKGIGKATARRLLREGVEVVGVDLDADALEATARALPGLVSVVGDIGAWETHERAADAAEERGRLAYWVNNAGVDRAGGAHEVDADELEQSLRVLQLGPMYGCAVAVRRMLATSGGAIVNVSSIQGIAAFPRYFAYQAAKAAIAMASKGIAVDYGPYGIRCNALLPGAIDTPMTRDALADAPDLAAALREEGVLSPLERVGTADEMANAVWFLLSDESSYVSGAALVADGASTARCFAYPRLDPEG
jgi:NAD(P)-dependent dehydrogenase (short-subunit alcohol dehydrogenase family)